jgi:hypothetical protein
MFRVIAAVSLCFGLAGARRSRPPTQQELLELLQTHPAGRPPHVSDVTVSTRDTNVYVLYDVAFSTTHFCPVQFDCAWRYFALQYASQIQPWLTAAQLQLVNNSLAFQTACAGVDYTPPPALPPTRTALFPPPASGLHTATCTGVCIFVDATKGSDSNPGTESAPLRTIPAAINATRSSGSPSPTIVLRNGTFYINSTITLTPADSGLTIAAYEGEAPVLSGGIPAVVSWSPFNVSNSTSWGPVLVDENAVYGQCGNAGVPNKVRAHVCVCVCVWGGGVMRRVADPPLLYTLESLLFAGRHPHVAGVPGELLRRTWALHRLDVERPWHRRALHERMLLAHGRGVSGAHFKSERCFLRRRGDVM